MFRIVDRGGVVVAASAAVVCLATLSWVVAGANATRDARRPGGYVVVGGADPSGSASGRPSPPSRTATLASGDPAAAATGASSDASGMVPDYGPMVPSARPSGRLVVPVRPGQHSASASVSASPSPSGSRKPSPTPTPTTPAQPVPPPPFRRAPVTPDTLTVSAPTDSRGEHSWCEYVTVTYTNAGATPVTSGDAVFSTRVTDPMGFDWGNYSDSVPVPVPIAPAAAVTRTYEVCLAPWRVPPGLRMETTGVTLVA